MRLTLFSLDTLNCPHNSLGGWSGDNETPFILKPIAGKATFLLVLPTGSLDISSRIIDLPLSSLIVLTALAGTPEDQRFFPILGRFPRNAVLISARRDSD